MQIYWRVINELEELGEVLVFHDPSIFREYWNWCRRNNVVYQKGFKTSPYLREELLIQIKQAP